MGDPERYRQQDEVKKWQENDPIGIFRAYLLKKKVATEAQLDELDAKAQAETDKSVEFAEASPEPGMDELFKDIYAE